MENLDSSFFEISSNECQDFNDFEVDGVTIMQSLRESISRLPPLSLILSIVLFLGYLTTLFFPHSKRYVVLVPGKVSFALWTCVTSSFVVLNPIEIMVDLVTVLFVGRIVMPVYGTFEMVKYLLFVAGVTGMATFAVSYVTFVIGRSVSALYIQISGFHGLLGALLVAFKQVAPDHVLIFCDMFSVRAQWLPSIYVLLGIPVGLLYRPLGFYPFLLFGTYFSWFYLRYLQVDPGTQLKGDPSPSFNFASFFPEIIRPPVNSLASFCSKVFHITPKQPTPAYSLSPSNEFQHDPYDQARRRERGQRALDARLNATNGSNPRSTEQTNVDTV